MLRPMVRQAVPAVIALVVFTVLCGLVYPLVVTGVAQVAVHDKANGSIVKVNGSAVGSRLIGQDFAAPNYFHPRPSAAGTGYDGEASAPSNLGPSNPDFLSTVVDRLKAYRVENNLSDTAEVPVDAVTASGSGLDPDISVANAEIQATRVAQARGLPADQVLKMVKAHTTDRQFGIFGEPRVNVLELNLALDGQ